VPLVPAAGLLPATLEERLRVLEYIERHDALAELKRGLDLAPGNTRFAYVYGVALLSSGRQAESLEVFERALAQRPADRDLLIALATAHRYQGEFGLARDYARRLVEAAPSDPGARRLLEEMESAAHP
jgi:Flp pilus assembly protein TadD